MALPVGRGEMRVRSCGLMMKRAWTRRGAMTDGMEDGLVPACGIDVALLRHYPGQWFIGGTSAQVSYG